MLLRTLFIAILSFFSLLSTSIVIGDETNPANLANACTGCHGGDGPTPSINDLTSSEISSLMRSFKNDEIIVTIMNRIAKGYTDEEIDAIANYFGAK